MLKQWLGLVLFGIAFGYVEATLVVYLRDLYEPLRTQVYPEVAADTLFPLLKPQDLTGTEAEHRLLAELGREAATLIMLAAAALPAATSVTGWMAGFLLAFGVWDIFYYVFLKVLIDWPASLMTWDLLFLLPVTWVGPVIAPVLVAAAMIVCGTIVMWREAAGRPIALRWTHWAAIVIGGVIIVVACCWDYRNILSGGLPNPFNWPLFLVGLLLGCVAFVHGARRPPAATALDY